MSYNSHAGVMNSTKLAIIICPKLSAWRGSSGRCFSCCCCPTGFKVAVFVLVFLPTVDSTTPILHPPFLPGSVFKEAALVTKPSRRLLGIHWKKWCLLFRTTTTTRTPSTFTCRYMSFTFTGVLCCTSSVLLVCIDAVGRYLWCHLVCGPHCFPFLANRCF